jgi:hypothetical protein
MGTDHGEADGPQTTPDRKKFVDFWLYVGMAVQNFLQRTDAYLPFEHTVFFQNKTEHNIPLRIFSGF